MDVPLWLIIFCSILCLIGISPIIGLSIGIIIDEVKHCKGEPYPPDHG